MPKNLSCDFSRKRGAPNPRGTSGVASLKITNKSLLRALEKISVLLKVQISYRILEFYLIMNTYSGLLMLLILLLAVRSFHSHILSEKEVLH
jgi:hypothetical protein